MGGFSFLSDSGQEHFLDRIKLLVKEALPIEKALPVHDGEVRAFHRNGGSDLEPLQVLHEPFVHLRDEDFLRAKFVQQFLTNFGFVEQVKAFAMSQHQCIVAEVVYDVLPVIATGATPGDSDKLVQRNLTVQGGVNV